MKRLIIAIIRAIILVTIWTSVQAQTQPGSIARWNELQEKYAPKFAGELANDSIFQRTVREWDYSSERTKLYFLNNIEEKFVKVYGLKKYPRIYVDHQIHPQLKANFKGQYNVIVINPRAIAGDIQLMLDVIFHELEHALQHEIRESGINSQLRGVVHQATKNYPPSPASRQAYLNNWLEIDSWRASKLIIRELRKYIPQLQPKRHQRQRD